MRLNDVRCGALATMVVMLCLATTARGEIIASSIDGWSADGAQGENGWTNGYFNVTEDGTPDPLDEEGFGYTPEFFIEFEEPDYIWNGNAWDEANEDGDNVPWTTIGQENGHPNGDNNGDVHFAMRRWVSDVTPEGNVFLVANLAKQNTNCGNGTTAHVYHNGVIQPLFDGEATSIGLTVSGNQGTFLNADGEETLYFAYAEVALKAGDIIDMALSPGGDDGSFADGCDGSFFNLVIDTEQPAIVTPPEFITSSVEDWSADGEQGENGWTYGYFNVTADGDLEEEEGYGYTPDLFIDFEEEEDDWAWNGNAWDSTLGNVPWTTINEQGGHPNGDNNGDVHFAIRRWESDTEGEVEITQRLSKTNTNCGNGTTTHVYQNGVLLDTLTVEGGDGVGDISTISTTLAAGDLIDFALSPLGVDGTFADGCDGSNFILEIVKPADSGVTGDFNGNGELDAEDIDLLSAAVGGDDLSYDLDANGVVDNADRVVWVHDLSSTYFGDSNLDGEFNSTDLVVVFSAGEYEDALVGNSTWATGDWNGDTEFSSSDLVTAFADGGFEQGPRMATASVPEPSALALIGIGLLSILGVRRRA